MIPFEFFGAVRLAKPGNRRLPGTAVMLEWVTPVFHRESGMVLIVVR